MKHCSHSRWLHVCVRDEETTLTETDRLQTLIDQLPNSDTKYPSCAVFIGNKAKSRTLQELVAVNNQRRCKRNHGEVHLYMDSSSAFQERPLLFADGDVPDHETKDKEFPPEKCHRSTIQVLVRSRNGHLKPNLKELTDNLYIRLLHPFADVFCLFAIDFGGLRSIARCVASWLEKSTPSTFTARTSPQLIIIQEDVKPDIQTEAAARTVFLRLLTKETTKDIFNLFAAVHVLFVFPESMVPTQVSAQARHRRFKERLMSSLDETQRRKSEAQMLLSARHFVAFFECACDHFATDTFEPFDFVRASRLRTPVSPTLVEHLTNFLTEIKSPEELTRFGVPLIASSILMDSCPPDMHRK